MFIQYLYNYYGDTILTTDILNFATYAANKTKNSNVLNYLIKKYNNLIDKTPTGKRHDSIISDDTIIDGMQGMYIDNTVDDLMDDIYNIVSIVDDDDVIVTYSDEHAGKKCRAF